MRDLLLTRSRYQGAAGAQEREKIRTRITSTMLKAARQGLVRKGVNDWSITDRGRQFVIAGIHSRASTYRLGTLTMQDACEMCEEDEMPGCHTPGTSETWPSTITADFARNINAWMSQGARARAGARRVRAFRSERATPSSEHIRANNLIETTDSKQDFKTKGSP